MQHIKKSSTTASIIELIQHNFKLTGGVIECNGDKIHRKVSMINQNVYMIDATNIPISD